jgi:DNA helicase-2/ATP-dependent DNA helicase PcrA
MQPAIASSFLGELPPELLDAERPEDFLRVRQQAFTGNAAPSSAIADRQNGKSARYRRGMKVEHPLFGIGIVAEVEGKGNDTRLRVRFETAGDKLLMARFAPLRVLG